SASSARALLTLDARSGGRRSLGFEARAGGVGHTGFTGTLLWIDPDADLALVVLTSRLHPDERGDVRELRAALERLVREVPGDRAVRAGIDVLAGRDFDALRGKRVVLLSNAAARAAGGRTTAEVLAHAAGVTVVRLLSPEHGFGAAGDGPIA